MTKTIVIKMSKKMNDSELINETKIRKYLQDINGIPPIIDYGLYKKKQYIIYPYNDKSIKGHLINKNNINDFAFQMIKIITDIHKKGIVHCDISPSNVLHNLKTNEYMLNDFGNAKHINFAFKEINNSCNIINPFYCSKYLHNGYEYSPRDDLISIGYLLIYCLEGSLPWSKIKICNDIYKKKLAYDNQLPSCNLPSNIKTYLNYCTHLGINEKPNYCMLSQLFMSSMDSSLSVESML